MTYHEIARTYQRFKVISNAFNNLFAEIKKLKTLEIESVNNGMWNVSIATPMYSI